jgi:hypothetical protein
MNVRGSFYPYALAGLTGTGTALVVSQFFLMSPFPETLELDRGRDKIHQLRACRSKD